MKDAQGGDPDALLECVINISEGRDPSVIAAVASAAGGSLLDVHSDPHHNRSVLTLGGPRVLEHARNVAQAVVERIDITNHVGVHPRLGALDVVPFVPLGVTTLDEAVAARDRFARWAGEELGLPCFLYGPHRSLPLVRKQAFRTIQPDLGPARPHVTAGACAVGARGVLLAYNLWLADADLARGRQIAARIRGPHLRTLGLDVGGEIQVSCNLIEPGTLGPEEVYDLVAAEADISRAELVGLLPEEILKPIPRQRWAQLDLSPAQTIERRLAGSVREFDP